MGVTSSRTIPPRGRAGHGDTSGDFPSTHLRADVNHFVLLDPEDSDRLATGNDDGLIHFEWEAGVYPAWAWAGSGDRVVGLGRWIFDCGHPGAVPGNCSATMSQQCVIDSDCPSGETCVGAHFNYSAEMHPPQATAAIRLGRGAVLLTRAGAPAVPATRADIYVSPDAGGAGDRCIVTHRANAADLLSVECFPLAQPVAAQGPVVPLNAQDFHFDVPLPPRPSGGVPKARLVTYPAPTSTWVPTRAAPATDASSRTGRTLRISSAWSASRSRSRWRRRDPSCRSTHRTSTSTSRSRLARVAASRKPAWSPTPRRAVWGRASRRELASAIRRLTWR